MEKCILNEILQNNKNSYRYWHDLLNNTDAEYQLLYVVSPLINYTYNEIKNITDNLSQVVKLVNNRFIKNIVLKFFKHDIGIMLFRSLVSELHSAKANGILKRKSSKKRFIEFIETIANVNAVEIILTKYSQLKTLVMSTIKQFLNELKLFFIRLNHDYYEIQSTLSLKGLNDYCLCQIEFTGDKHQHGKRVIVANFSNTKDNIHLVYKPRNLDLLDSLNNFFLWVSSNTGLNFKLPKTIIRDQYGWQSFIYKKPCHSTEDATHYFYQLGGLLCLFHLLNSQDIHSENIIASGKNPILIDCECLLTPVILQNKEQSPRTRNLVCSSLVLPTRNMSNIQYSGFDNSVIGNTQEQVLPFNTLSWDKQGTDEMTLKRIPAKLLPHKNSQHLDSVLLDPLDFEEYFLNGFIELYQFFLSRKNELENDIESPLNIFNNCLSRVIIRPTNQYARLIFESYHPILLYDKNKRAIHFSFLENNISLTPEYKHFIKSEINSLNEANIPIFYTTTSNKHIYDCDKNQIAAQSIMSPIEHCKHNLRMYWGRNDLKIQTTIIKNSFSTLNYPRYQNRLLLSKKVNKTQIHDISSTKLKQNILSICKSLYSTLIEDDIYISWPCIIPAGSKVTHSITDNTLYNGTLGIIYTLGICGYLFDISEYKDLVYRYTKFILNESKNYNFFKSVGLYDGLGGAIYFLYYFSEVIPLIDGSAVNDLLSRFNKFSFEDNKHDIMSGNSGFLLSLIKAKNLIANDMLINHLERCRNSLISMLENPDHGILIPSYAHGITGVYYALFQLNEITGDNSLINYIKKCLSIENSFYDEKINSWINPQVINNKNVAWCHGAVGIGLARLILKDKIKPLDSKNDHYIRSAINTTLFQGFQTDPCLCHGHAGSLDFLLEAKIRCSTLLDETLYYSYLNEFISKINIKELYFYKLKDSFVPGLLDGLSGIVYLLLRIVFETKVPSILMV